MAAIGLSGGTALEARLKEIAKNASTSAELRVGFFEGATEKTGESVAMIAAIQEFGAPGVGIPPRPFFRTMIAKESPHWGDDIGKLLIASDYEAGPALSLMGEEISGALRQSIIDLTTPALSPVTLMLREMRHQNPGLVVNRTVVEDARARVAAGQSYSGASTKPLIDSGIMLQSVGYEVT